MDDEKPVMTEENKENKPSEKGRNSRKSIGSEKEETIDLKSSIMKEQFDLFNVAFVERKSMNLQRLKEYMKKRKQSFQERSRIYTNLRILFFDKQKYTKAFVKSIIKYFSDFVELYQYYLKSLSKFELKKKPKDVFMYGSLHQSIIELNELNDNESEHVQKFVDWIQKILISALRSTENLFKDRLKKLNSQIEKADDVYFSNWNKEEKTYEKMSTGNDLLQKQMCLIEKIKITNETTITRGLEVYNAWQQLLEEEKGIKKIIKENILQFHERFTNLHKKADKAESLFKYWAKLEQNPTVLNVFASIFDEKEAEFINFGCKSKKLQKNYQHFMRMAYEEKRIGNPFPFLQILIAKKFKAKMQKSQREWDETRLIFSVDHNFLVYSEKEGKTMIKLKENTLTVKRISQNILELSGIQEGFLFDSSRKISIHFDSLDVVQEFIYFINELSSAQKEAKS